MMRSIGMSLRNVFGSGETPARRALVVGTGTAEEIERTVAHLRREHPNTPVDVLADPWIERPGVTAFELPGLDGGSHRLWRRLRNQPYDVVAVLWTGNASASLRWKLLGAFSLLATRVWIVTEYGSPFALSRPELRTLARHAALRWRQGAAARPTLGHALKLALGAPLLLAWSLLLRVARGWRRLARST